MSKLRRMVEKRFQVLLQELISRYVDGTQAVIIRSVLACSVHRRLESHIGNHICH